MSKKRLVVAALGGTGVVATLAYLLGFAHAAGIPTMAPVMTYAGTLTDAGGAPLTGSRNIQVMIWSQATGGTTPACQTASAAQTLVAGTFQVALPDTCTAAARAAGDLWVEVLVDGGSLGRTKLGAVPFSVEADHSVSATNATNATNAMAGRSAPTWRPIDPLSAGKLVLNATLRSYVRSDRTLRIRLADPTWMAGWATSVGRHGTRRHAIAYRPRYSPSITSTSGKVMVGCSFC